MRRIPQASKPTGIGDRNRECSLELDEAVGSEKARQHCFCDAEAIDLRHGAVYLCDTALDEKLQLVMSKLSAWTKNRDSIKAALRRDYKVPANWRVHVWLFLPRDSIEMLDEELEQLRQTVGARFKVKLTALEDVQPCAPRPGSGAKPPGKSTVARNVQGTRRGACGALMVAVQIHAASSVGESFSEGAAINRVG